MKESGVIKLDGESKAALVYGQMNEPPGARARVALTGLAIAEYFRDEEGQDVLLFIDNIFRFTQVKLCSMIFIFFFYFFCVLLTSFLHHSNFQVFSYFYLGWF